MMTIVRYRKANPWSRIRVQLGGCLLFGALLPYIVRLAIADLPGDAAILAATLIGNVIAMVLATWLVRNVSTYPGAEAYASILPSFALSYGLLLTALVLGRFDYNRSILTLGFVISVGWFFFSALMAQRHRQLRVGVLPFGDTAPLAHLTNVEWVVIPAPDSDVSALDAIAADLRIDLPSEWDRRLADYALMGIQVFHTKHLAESLTGRVELEHLSENSIGSLAPRAAYMAIKHAVDWLMAAVGGLFLLPFLLLIALAIRLTSPGPALFVQERVGYLGRPFRVYKFRTMTLATETPDDPRHAALHDEVRVTRIGRVLRKTRIDELPQLINVLRGEMSWIGPRPEAAVLSRWYEAEIPFYRYRHIVRPGIAGWAQVSQGHVAEVAEVRSKLHYDFYYIKNYSPWIDLLIVTRTIRTMVTGFGSR